MSLTLNEYQQKAFATNKGTRVYVQQIRRQPEEEGSNYYEEFIESREIPAWYNTTGMLGEAGEFAEKVKKNARDGKWDAGEAAKELGDVLWYLSQIASDIGYTLEEIAQINLAKLASRRARGVISGSGDNR